METQKNIYQAKNDGTVIIQEQSEKYSNQALREILENSISKEGWSTEFVEEEAGLYVYNMINTGITLQLYIYLTNVRWSSRGRAKEQRIQLNSNLSDKGFNIISGITKKCLVLGIYEFNEKVIFCTWEARKKNNHGKQKSCYIDIDTIATAMRDGFSRREDGVGDVVCAFRPEFIHFYIMNLEWLHTN